MNEQNESIALYYTEFEGEKEIIEKTFVNYRTIDCMGHENDKLEHIISGRHPKEPGTDEKIKTKGYSFLIFHGFENKEIIEILKFIRKVTQRPWIFATTTENNINAKFKDLIEELIIEHEEMHNIK
ncbi:DUF3783 domain-containing protein [Kosmotoga pacifica]|uniref:Uncharacterized protein n=1 Tax=Kosmotoga pacifica TaxID=1330330 RepID=A0A0G2Z5X4_9BACT|nr:DUF3783 domain-containing protein [Kosmotoga pacifica]AKI96942.1 hypothetical protein IX53_02900 [Kosmotoga pacifica]